MRINIKKITSFFIGFFLLLVSPLALIAQNSVDLTIKNQRISNDSLFFDVYLKNSGSGEIYLANCDFLFSYDSTNFNSATRTFSYVENSMQLVDNTGSSIAEGYYQLNTTFGNRNNPGRLKIGLTRYAADLTNVAKIDNSGTHKLGTFAISGMLDVSRFSEMKWITENTWGSYTRIFSMSSVYPYTATEIPLGTITEPDPVAPPTVQSSNITFSNITSKSLTLTIGNIGNGAKRIILAKAGSALNSDELANAVTYTADTAFGKGSKVGDDSVFVVYNGSGNSVNVGNLDASTPYYFAVYEYNGANGQTENYVTPGIYAQATTVEPYVIVNIKAFLYGPYNATTGLMTTSLNTAPSLIPKSHPYSAAPFNYSDTEKVASAFLVANPTIVDWVYVELRQATQASLATASTVKAKRACFLLKDGTLLDTSGNVNVKFYDVVPGDYYVVLKHRNHLGVMSANKISLSGKTSTQYDFTTAITQAHKKTSSAISMLGNGSAYSLYPGDGDASGRVNTLDYNIVWKSQSNSINQYKSADYDLSRRVNTLDYNIFWKAGSGGISQIP